MSDSMGSIPYILILALLWNHGYGGVEGAQECLAETKVCEFSKCIQTPDSFRCECYEGYMSRSPVSCVDIDECVENPDICKQHETCNNQPGTYLCMCPTGFTYDDSGTMCLEENMCADNPTICGDHSICLNTNGSYKCECVPGFRMEPTKTNGAPEQCLDINECEVDRFCGEGGSCHNLIGSYWCQCSDGFSNYGNIQTKCIELSCDQLEKQPGQTLPGFDNLLTLMKDNCLMLRNSSSTGPKGQTGDVLLKALVNATNFVQRGIQEGGNLSSSDVVNFLQTVENSIRLITPQLKENLTRMVSNYTEAEILVNRDRTQPKGPVSLTNEKAQLDTSWETVAGDEQNYPGFAYVILLSYKTLSSLNVSSSLQSQQLMSSVSTVSISNPNSKQLLQPVKLTFSHLQSSGADLDCVYLSEEDGLGVWSGRGCTTVMSNSTHTICSCDHLSSFAVIQGLQQQKEGNGLSTVMWVCLLVALACVVLSLITTMWCRSVSRKRNHRQSQQSAQFHTK
ncbi:hypothetical protein UPYG_G00217640 [Umbra pygmaea]|uniref:Uncharacterized protein n=1 Tax=Umbra pygmaea TaxID=75934 RepID=A0ABD0XBK2_UMBPY